MFFPNYNLLPHCTMSCHVPTVRTMHQQECLAIRSTIATTSPIMVFCVNRGVQGGGCIMLWWLDFRGEWRGCSRIGWLLCRNGCISECCHEIGLYCVHWSSMEGSSDVGAGVGLFITLGVLTARQSQVPSDVLRCGRSAATLQNCVYVFWYSKRTLIVSGRRRWAA